MIMSHVSSLPNFVRSHGKYKEAMVVSVILEEYPLFSACIFCLNKVIKISHRTLQCIFRMSVEVALFYLTVLYLDTYADALFLLFVSGYILVIPQNIQPLRV